MIKSFEQFLEFRKAQGDFIDKGPDELEIQLSALEDTPMWVANITLGDQVFNGMTASIQLTKGRDGEVSGAMLTPMQIQRVYRKDGDRMIRVPSESAVKKPVFISRAQLMQIVGQGQSPQDMAAAGGGMPPL